MDPCKQPKVFASLSLDPTTYSFSSSEVPKLNVTLLLEHGGPITIYADDLSPSRMLTRGAFTISSPTSDVEVKQSIRTNCKFEPPTKIQVILDGDKFHTLQPDTPFTFSSPFSQLGVDKPRPADHADHARHRPAVYSCGVDGLEPGHEYVLSLADKPRMHWHHIRWWDYGTKAELLRNGYDARKVKFKKGPHGPIHIDTSEIKPVRFRCID